MASRSNAPEPSRSGTRSRGRDRPVVLTPAAQGRGSAIRELAVRMLGRDCRENGKVEYTRPEARQPAAALAHLDTLLPLADDPDPGVRRELILALRNLPTEKVGEALKTLTASWDGQDRWYLEALGGLAGPEARGRPAPAAGGRADPPRRQFRQGQGRLLPRQAEFVRGLPPGQRTGAVDRLAPTSPPSAPSTARTSCCGRFSTPARRSATTFDRWSSH